MIIIKVTLLLYNLIIVCALITIGFLTQPYEKLSPTLLLIPVGLYFSIAFFAVIHNITYLEKNKKLKKLLRVLKIYSFITISLIILASLTNSTSIFESLLAIVFLPLIIYFPHDVFDKALIQDKIKQFHVLTRLLKYFASMHMSKQSKKKKKSGNTSEDDATDETITPEYLEIDPKMESKKELVAKIMSDEENNPDVQDFRRRQFLKIIGGGGVSLFLMLFVFKKDASAAFFGSGGGPGIVSLKDSSGNQIDPAEKQPTDGYSISEVDDDDSPSYYGFIHKNGAWYIAKEESTGAYRYTKGASSFSTNWTNRTSLTYDYFDNIF